MLINEDADPQILRELDKIPYKIVFSVDEFGMRGIDYRSRTNVLHLVVAQQFSCTREALQGVARVGRFGDPCKKIKFSDCQNLVDKRLEGKYHAELLEFIAKLKKRVKVKPAKASRNSPKKNQPEPTSGYAPSAVALRQLK